MRVAACVGVRDKVTPRVWATGPLISKISYSVKLVLDNQNCIHFIFDNRIKVLVLVINSPQHCFILRTFLFL